MNSEIKPILSKLEGTFDAIIKQAMKYSDEESNIRPDGTIQIFRRPWVAPLNYGIVLFPPAQNNFFEKFTERTGKSIPKIYEEVLEKLNGCFVYDFSLYGLPTSMYSTGLLDRSGMNQFDLGTANSIWIREYNIDNHLFYIGGRTYSRNENLGYFINGNKILAIRKNGEIIKSYNSFGDFLSEEVSIAEQMMLEKAPENIKLKGKK